MIEVDERQMGLYKIKVDGGHLYLRGDVGMCFVPEIDLARYQSHLRDAYDKGYKDGVDDSKHRIPLNITK